MNCKCKEIKEILDKCTPYLFGDEVDKLLDYITNLQTKLKKIKETINHYATEDDDYSKIYSVEEKDLLSILQGEDKE